MITVRIVDNPNIEIINNFQFKCRACGTIKNYEDSGVNCSECDARLFEPMKVAEFEKLFAQSLVLMEVPEVKINEFISKRNVKVQSLGICSEMSVLIDVNFDVKYGGQYKSFLIKDTMLDILSNNFKRKK